MKRIEEIENLEMDDLERIARDSRVEVPADLDSQLLAAIVASSAEGAAPRRSNILKIVPGIAAVGIAACLAIMFMTSDEPEDTFDDPRLAYAELEKTMSLVSSKIEKGMDMAAEAGTAIEVTDRMINKTIEIK